MGFVEQAQVRGHGIGGGLDRRGDQRNAAVFTTPYQLPTNDTLPGAPYPMPVSAPTMSPVLDFAGGEAWRVLSMTMYFFDVGGEP